MPCGDAPPHDRRWPFPDAPLRAQIYHPCRKNHPVQQQTPLSASTMTNVFLLPMAPSSNATNNSYRPSSITRETFYISDAIPRTALSAIQPTTIIANRSEIATERLPCKASPQTTITKRRLPSSTTSPASAGVPSLCNYPLFPSWACSAACCRRQS